ncbi:VHS-domain-containing protein, partial [Auricularia subglabra TFB-10046 SS5]
MLGDGWTSVSPVEIYVQRACDPSLHEPNYAVHLELAEYINTKKANTPREAAMAIVRLINHRNPHVSMLALGLLDSLVQGCGYAFHLQISTKEFLNELVRRFPERPPPFPGPVMQRILETIHGWKNGICVDSRWKEDLGNIRDMHRLLTFKGYRFRDLPAQHAIPGTSALKSPEELEADDREAQAAKLQELIRRGTPRDLAAAQELMKIMAGAKPEAKPDYRAQTLTELSKLQGKVVLLNEMLDNVDPARGERFAAGDAYHQVSLLLVQARPKIQKWIGNAETADDPESLETLLQVNDQINAVLTRYEAFKNGDY